MRFRVLVCGGRKYENLAAVFAALDELAEEHPAGLHIIEGGATGADRLARRWAWEHSQSRETFYADWDQFRLAAGHIRNRRMLVEGRPDLVVAFPGGNGTRGMVRLAMKAGLPVRRPMAT